MIRYCILFAFVVFMAFLALYDNSADFGKLYKDLLTPMGWKKIEIVDEKRSFEDMLNYDIPWASIELLLLGTAAIVIGVTVGWRAHSYCSVYGSNMEPDLLEKFIEKLRDIEARLTTLELKVSRLETKPSTETELIYSRDHRERDFSCTKDAFQQIVIQNTDSSCQTSQPGSYPPSVAEVEEEVEDLRCESPVWAMASDSTLVVHNNPEPVEFVERDVTPDKDVETAEVEEVERTLYEVEVFPVEIDLGPCDTMEDSCENRVEPERTVSESTLVKVLDAVDAATCAVVGAGECDSRSTTQERRIPQFQGLRKNAEQKTRLYTERPTSATKVLEPVQIPGEVTKLPRTNTTRKYGTEGVEVAPTGRRRKQRHSQVK
ncbi:uncharacterized protein LOC124365261 isoform X1 [Homalodisca vitripennis]|uniref:uncharacterized protein LOC124365261 isoform X1 n=2 Tax=Homalodisca vitripennis TaxID=197043 RepID=UPI001EEC3333|nr:uncharacterized protein LOC124365261 isoform X1 [Homalodisca vitripennis]